MIKMREKGIKNRWDKQKTNSNMTAILLTISIITLKVNGGVTFKMAEE